MRTALPPKIEQALVSACRTEAIDVVLAWIETRRDILVLEGGTGAGKSVAAAWAFAHYRHRGRAPVWASMPEVATLAEWKTDEWEPFDAASLIVLDDLGTERDANRAAMVLERVSNLAAGRCVITTNVPVDEVLSRYGERVQSRIIGAAHWVTLGGRDLRVQPPKGEMAPDPDAKTAAEIAWDDRREQAARDRHNEDIRRWESDQRERDAMLARMNAELAEKTSHRPSAAQIEADDNARRQVLAQQVEELRKRNEEAAQ